MPKFLEEKLKAEYPNNPSAVFGTMNKLGAMRGNKETAKGAAMQAQHVKDMAAPKAPRPTAPHIDRGHTNIRNPKNHAAKLRNG